MPSVVFRRAAEPTPAVDDGTIVRAEGIVKSYRAGRERVAVLKGIDFAVGRGEMVAVMGPSGSGKSTLLNTLSGLDAPDQGRIVVEGQDLARLSDRARTDYRARRMGMVFGAANLLPVLSAVENVELPLLVAGTRPPEARAKAHKALETVGLGGRGHHRPAELSAGQRQRVGIARALVNDPAVIWADEPTEALDARTADEIVGLLRELNRWVGLSVVIVTHDAGVGTRCDRTVRLRDGRVVGQEVAADRWALAAD